MSLEVSCNQGGTTGSSLVPTMGERIFFETSELEQAGKGRPHENETALP